MEPHHLIPFADHVPSGNHEFSTSMLVHPRANQFFPPFFAPLFLSGAKKKSPGSSSSSSSSSEVHFIAMTWLPPTGRLVDGLVMAPICVMTWGWFM